MSDEQTPCYIGVSQAPCHHAVAAIVDDSAERPAWKREVARTVAEWVRDGLSVERSTVGAVRAGLLQTCEQCCPSKKRAAEVAAQTMLAL
jgi:hypothetical protein